MSLREKILEDVIAGGLSDNKSFKDIAEKHKTPVKQLYSQLKKGIKVEMEHTSDWHIAMEIAKDHLDEDPKYYDKLASIEKGNEKNN